MFVDRGLPLDACQAGAGVAIASIALNLLFSFSPI